MIIGKIFRIFVFFVSFSFSFACVSSELVLKVGVLNSDANDIDCPCLSTNVCILSLRDAFKLLNTPSWAKVVSKNFGQVRLVLGAGVFRLDEPLIINWDSEKLGANLVIEGEGEKTVITGSRLLRPESVSLYSKDKIIYSVDFDVFGIDEKSYSRTSGFGVNIYPVFPQLFSGDYRFKLTRAPSSGMARLILSGQGNRFRIEGLDVNQFVNDSNLEAHGFWFYDWADNRFPVFLKENGEFELTKFPAFGIKDGQRVVIENVFSMLVESGSWYVDYVARKIYFIPLEGGVKDVEISLATTGIRVLNSKNVIVKSVKIINFRGDSIDVRDSKDINFDNLIINNVGNRALVIYGGSNCGLNGSKLKYLGEGGVVLDGGDRKELKPARHYVTNSDISFYSERTKAYRYAIDLFGVGQLISGNKISNAPHGAIQFSGNDHQIVGNDISFVVKETSDSGAIYVGRDYASQGNLIAKNYIHDISPKNGFETKGVYIDDQASGVSIIENVFVGVPQAVFIGGGRDNIIGNNFFYESSPSIHFDARGVLWQKNDNSESYRVLRNRLNSIPYLSKIWKDRYPHLAHIKEDDFGYPKYNSVCGNVFIGGQAYDFHRPEYSVKGVDFGVNYFGKNSSEVRVFFSSYQRFQDVLNFVKELRSEKSYEICGGL